MSKKEYRPRLSAEEFDILQDIRNKHAALEQECIAQGLPLESVKQYWWKGEHFSINLRGQGGKTYEEILGKDKALQLRKLRSEKAKCKNNSGKNNPMYGRKHTKEVKSKHSNRMKGVNHPTYGFTWITNGEIGRAHV